MEPRIPTWMERAGSSSPSSTARLNGVPGVRVGVELDEGQRSVDGRGSAQLGQGYGMIAAQDYRDDAGAVYGLEAFAYLLVALLYEARDHRHVPVVDHG